MARMTYHQKGLRREARYFGTRALQTLTAAIHDGREADQWQRLVPDADDRIAYWQQRADRALAEAVSLTRAAAKLARLAIEAQEQGL